MMDNKTGWVRTTMIERLYPLTGTFEKAKLLFDKYYTKVSCVLYEVIDKQEHPMEIQFGAVENVYF